jgi:hypothetical protein
MASVTERWVVLFDGVMLVTVTPVPPMETFIPVAGKLLPFKFTVATGSIPEPVGPIDPNVGAPSNWKFTVPLTPDVVDTETTRLFAAAPGAIRNVAVIDVSLFTLTLVTPTPVPLTEMKAAPAAKPDPVNVTLTVCPRLPFTGLIDVRVGVAAVALEVEIKVQTAAIIAARTKR